METVESSINRTHGDLCIDDCPHCPCWCHDTAPKPLDAETLVRVNLDEWNDLLATFESISEHGMAADVEKWRRTAAAIRELLAEVAALRSASHRQETEGETEALIAKVPHWGRATDGSILPATACREWEQDECIRLGGQCMFTARGKGGS